MGTGALGLEIWGSGRTFVEYLVKQLKPYIGQIAWELDTNKAATEGRVFKAFRLKRVICSWQKLRQYPA